MVDPEPIRLLPACQNLLLAARALGYGGGLTMWHPSATIALGRPEGRNGAVRRRPVGELVFADRWGDAAPWATEPEGARHTSAGPPRAG